MTSTPNTDPVVPLGSLAWNPRPLRAEDGTLLYPEHVILQAADVVDEDGMNRVRIGRAVYFMASANADGSRYAVCESLDT